MRQRAKVCVFYTGGTFGMVPSIPTEDSSPLLNADVKALKDVLKGYGKTQGIVWELRSLTQSDGSEVGPIDSSAVGPDHWLNIAEAIDRVYAEFDGFVVIHGTDTLAYTASALSFLLVNLAKPVVLTGSQRPIFLERNDARQNFLNALYVAGYKATGLPRIPEVCVCFGDVLLRGNRARKVSVEARTGFASPNYPPLGLFGESIQINRKRIRKAPAAERPFYIHRRLEDRVMDLTLYPGLKGKQLQPFFDREDIIGFVLRTFGSGTTPRDTDLLEAVARAARAGKVLLVVTQCLEGGVDLGRYNASTTLVESRVISGFDLTPEAALTKLMWMLALESGPELDAQIQMSHRGEQSHEHHHMSFEACQTADKKTYSGRPTAPFPAKHLNRAILRVRGAKCPELRFFLNAAGVDKDAPASDVRCLGTMTVEAGEGVADVTRVFKRLMVANRPIRLTVTAGGKPFSFERLDLNLLVRADN